MERICNIAVQERDKNMDACKLSLFRSEFQRHGCKEVFGLYGLFQDAKVVKLDETGVQDVKGRFFNCSLLIKSRRKWEL